jgi:hypothetical protein
MVLPEIDQLTAKGMNLFDFTPYPNVLKWVDHCAKSLKSYEKNFEEAMICGKDPKQWPEPSKPAPPKK